MIKSYRTILRGGEAEIVEKKSRFIAAAEHVETEEEAAAFMQGIRKKYWDASHHCSAYIIGKNAELMRCSDDGEPGQTAGRPMLDVLQGEELRDVCVVVTRYFGGTLLGTGGLVRAYSGAAAAGLRASRIVEKKLARQICLGCDYNTLGKLQYLIAKADYKILGSRYTDAVELEVLVPFDECAGFEELVTDQTGARTAITEGRQIYYGMDGREILLFEH